MLGLATPAKRSATRISRGAAAFARARVYTSPVPSGAHARVHNARRKARSDAPLLAVRRDPLGRVQRHGGRWGLSAARVGEAAPRSVHHRDARAEAQGLGAPRWRRGLSTPALCGRTLKTCVSEASRPYYPLWLGVDEYFVTKCVYIYYYLW